MSAGTIPGVEPDRTGLCPRVFVVSFVLSAQRVAEVGVKPAQSLHLLWARRHLTTLGDEHGRVPPPQQNGESAVEKQCRRAGGSESAVGPSLDERDETVPFEHIVGGNLKGGEQRETGGGQSLDYIL